MKSSQSKDIDAIMGRLDQWVQQRGSGHYIPADFVSTADSDFSLPEDHGIQQVREEIRDFALFLLGHQRTHRALEIGLGYFGSTHFLWRQIFDHISTIEYQKDRIFGFRENCRKFFGEHVLSDGISSFFFGYSSATGTLKSVTEYFKKQGPLDMLFIDGDHRYEGVLADWLLYKHLVSPGGIVAFHDAASGISEAGVPRLLRELSEGSIDGIKRNIQRIVRSRDCGIAYYIQTDQK